MSWYKYGGRFEYPGVRAVEESEVETIGGCLKRREIKSIKIAIRSRVQLV
jgi:hypothetical protein